MDKTTGFQVTPPLTTHSWFAVQSIATLHTGRHSFLLQLFEPTPFGRILEELKNQILSNICKEFYGKLKTNIV